MEEVHVLPQRNWTRAKLQTSRQISHLKPAPEPASSLLPSLSSGGVVNLHGPSDARRLPDQRVMKTIRRREGDRRRQAIQQLSHLMTVSYAIGGNHCLLMQQKGAGKRKNKTNCGSVADE